MKTTTVPAAALLLSYLGMHFGAAYGDAWLMALIVSLVGCGGVWYAHSHRSRSMRSYVASGVSLLGLACLLALFLLNAPARFEILSDQWLSALRPESPAQDQWLENASRQASPQAGNWLWNEQSIRPLPRRAQLKPGNRPEVFLQLDRPEDAATLLQKRVYLSAFALGRYHQAAWAITPSVSKPPQGRLAAIAPLISYEVFHPSNSSACAPLIALQGLTEAHTRFIARGDGVLLLPAQPASRGHRYRATSQPLQIDDLPENALSHRHAHLASDYLSQPSDPALFSALQEHILSRVGQGSLKQRLLRLRKILQQQSDYSLTIENPQNRDPLANFLFHEKKGHCEMFATAAAMAARAMGIPSRIAYGWVGGSYFETSRLFVFRAREAHAWTEVWIDDLGWVILDATPPLAVGRSRAAPPEEKPLSAEEMADPSSHDDHASTAPHWMTWLLAALGLTGTAWSWWRNCHDIPASQTTRTHAKNGTLTYEAQLQSWCRAEGIRPGPHWSLGEMLNALQPPPQGAAELRRYHYATRYGKEPRHLPTERRLARMLAKERKARQREGSNQGSR